MPFMADDPPSPRPRGHAIADPVAASSTVLLHQSIDEPNKVGHAGGTAAASGWCRPPASSRRTRAFSFSDRRAARTQPALPAPTTMKSWPDVEEVIVPSPSDESVVDGVRSIPAPGWSIDRYIGIAADVVVLPETQPAGTSPNRWW